MNLKQIISGNKILTILVMLAAYALWVTSPYTRTFLPFLLGSYVFAFIVYRKQRDEFKKMFSPDIWMHHTALNEAFIIIVLYGFSAFVIQKLYLFDPMFFAKATVFMFDVVGIQVITEQPTVTASILFIIFALLAHDASYYLAHRIMHINKYLWEFHKVHHSAEVMTPFTSLRHHPVVFGLHAILYSIFVGFVAAIFLYLYPSAASLHFIVQYQLAKVVFLTLGGALAHSHAHISYGPLDKYIISPAMHQVHHSEDPKHYDKNFGFMLLCFDRMFGTAYIPDKEERFTFGLGEEQNSNFHTLGGALLGPFARAWKMARKPDNEAVDSSKEKEIEA